MTKYLYTVLFTLGIALTSFAQVEYTSTGGGGAYSLTYPSNITALTNGLSFTFKANHTNTGAASLTVNGFSAGIKKEVTTDLDPNDILVGQVVTVVYDGTHFQMVTPVGNAGGGGSSALIEDADGDTEINLEAAADQDVIHFNLGDNAGYPGAEYFTMIGPRLEVINAGGSVIMGQGAGMADDLSNNNNVFIGFEAGQDNATGSQNVAMGYQALKNSTTGAINVAIGPEALKGNLTGGNNVAVGQQALLNNTTSGNTAVGTRSMLSNTGGTSNTALGNSSLYTNTIGNNNTALGNSALQLSTTGSNNTAVGSQSLVVSVGSNNTGVGNAAGSNTTSGNANTFLGYRAGIGNTTGGLNTVIGATAGDDNSTGTRLVLLGYNAEAEVDGLQNATAIGFNAAVGADNSLVLGSINGVNGATSNTNVGIGTTTPAATLDVTGTDAIILPKGTTAEQPSVPENGMIRYNTDNAKFEGYENSAWVDLVSAGGSTTSIEDTDGDTEINVEAAADEDMIRFYLGDGQGYSAAEYFRMTGPRLEVLNGGHSVFIGEGSGTNDNLVNNDNVGVGRNTLSTNVSGFNNVAIGNDALTASTSSHNVAVGAEALGFGTPSNGNVAVGTAALAYNNSNNNVAIGYQSMINNAGGYSNTAVGYATLPNSTGNFNAVMGQSAGNGLAGGNRNVFIGFASGANLSSGSSNIFIGNQSGGTGSSASNKLYIENSNSDTPLIYGDFSSDELAFNAKVGIGTINPNNKLSIVTDVSDGFEMQTYGNANTNMMSFIQYGGTIGSPSTTTTGASIGTSLYSGYGTSTDVAAARIRVVAESVFTDASSPGAILLETTATGSNFPTEKVRITSDGNVGIGESAPGVKLEVAGNVSIQDDGNRVIRGAGGGDLIPIAYGAVIADGTLQSNATSGDVSINYVGSGEYEINYLGSRTFSGVGEVAVIVTPEYAGQPVFMAYQVTGTKQLLIRVFDIGSTPIDNAFSFIIYLK